MNKHPTPNEPLWHALNAEVALKALAAGIDGLSDDEAARRLEASGPNALPKEAETSRLVLFLKQFHSGLNYILFAAAGVSIFTGHRFDAIAILAEVVINGAVGYVQERRAERALSKLRDMIVPTAAVRRGGRVVRVPAEAVVPGDIVLVGQGDRVTADVRVLDARDLRLDEAALTGESVPVEKRIEPVDAGAAIGDRGSMLFMGTLVTAGEGEGLVVATGSQTIFGGIARSLSAIRHQRTPLEIRVDVLGRVLAYVAVGFSIVIFLFGLFDGLPLLEMFLFAVAAAVSSIPEGLPVVLAITLAIGVQRMARRNAITRHLPAVETLGIVDVICTDKTGTLTEGKMTVRRIVTLPHETDVTGEGWQPEGEFRVGGARLALAEHPALTRVLRVASLCNRASVEKRDGRWVAIGDPTEAALVTLGLKGGFERAELLRTEKTLDEIPFTSERRYRAILHEYDGKEGAPRREIMAIGAFEVLIGASLQVMDTDRVLPLTPESIARLEDANARLAGAAMRVLAVAVKIVDGEKDEVTHEDLQGMTIVGLIGMTDPPRLGVAEAIGACQSAGIRVIMNTGDHRETAVAIAREVGILGREESADGRVFVDDEVAAMSDAELAHVLIRASVFARVSPQTKLRVVGALQSQGHVVAMTGDGINDAPALKRSDIGIAMGVTGTDVTKEVADMVLSDDAFSSIVNAVEEGRIIFRNVKQTTSYLVMTNIGEVVTILAALLLRLPLPLLPAQLLWLNIVTDGFTDVALATERRHGDELSRPPRKKTEPILTRNLLIMTLLTSALMAGGTLLMYLWAQNRDGDAYARSVAFLAMALFQLWNVFSMRSAELSIFKLGWWTNRWVFGGVIASLLLIALIMYVPAFQPVFRLTALGWKEWGLSLLVTSSVLWLVEGYKSFVRRGFIPARWL